MTAASFALVPCITLLSTAPVPSRFWRQRRCTPPKRHGATYQNIANITDIFNITDPAKTGLEQKTNLNL